MGNCSTCEHAVFDERWGEYKCKARQMRVYILLESHECPLYKKKKEKDSDKK